ncbi:MAG TPA: MBL fold metallo-hydrolase [Longimicrobiaceae bacterium]|nr:MBL fold metallo-hydrolase [Longimicrobiaceae bacterium]
MTEKRRLAVDLANVFDREGEDAQQIATLAWGDIVQFEESTERGVLVTFDGKSAFIKGKAAKLFEKDGEADRVLRVDFVDVQQGDGAVVETPEGRTMLIDGGELQLFARYLAARFRGTTAEHPKEIDCIVVTHGDADHFAGLTEIHAAERNERAPLFIHPKRVYHNGLVKRPGKLDGKELQDEEMLGATERLEDGTLVITGLVNDPREVPAKERNKFFKPWCRALDGWETRGGMELRRLDFGSNGRELFSFLDEGVQDGPRSEVEILGPIPVDVDGEPALKFLGAPTRRVGRNPGEPKFKGYSAGHTINGHSVILRLRYGNVRLLFAGDLNEEAEEMLTTEHPDSLRAEVLKVPHHGSADYSADFLRAVAPVVSVVSSGDESERVEHIHPRATLVAALGRHSREEVDEPVVLITELAAFFKYEGKATLPAKTGRRAKEIPAAFSRTAFGIVKVRTNGERLLVYTYSGASDMKEAYAFNVDAEGNVTATAIRK